MCDYVVLPLLNSSFEPGRAREVVEGFVNVDLRNIARAEAFCHVCDGTPYLS